MGYGAPSKFSIVVPIVTLVLILRVIVDVVLNYLGAELVILTAFFGITAYFAVTNPSVKKPILSGIMLSLAWTMLIGFLLIPNFLSFPFLFLIFGLMCYFGFGQIKVKDVNPLVALTSIWFVLYDCLYIFWEFKGINPLFPPILVALTVWLSMEMMVLILVLRAESPTVVRLTFRAFQKLWSLYYWAFIPLSIFSIILAWLHMTDYTPAFRIIAVMSAPFLGANSVMLFTINSFQLSTKFERLVEKQIE